jgi:uncharacterized protein (TIGR02996 family)
MDARQREALLAAVCEHPDDDAPRLVYADWLEENGDEVDRARAELIRLQLAGYKSLWWDGDYRRSDREQELIDRHAQIWFAELPALPGVIWHQRFHRGFPWWVSARSMPALQQAAPVLFRCAPIQMLSVTSRGVKTLARLPWLSQIRSLILDGNRLWVDDAFALADSPHLSGLQALWLVDNRIYDEGVEALAESPTLGRLVFLDIRFNHLTDCGARALACSNTLQSLQYLSLGDPEVMGQGALAFVRPNALPSLVSLGFTSDCRIEADVREQLQERFGHRVSFDDNP